MNIDDRPAINDRLQGLFTHFWKFQTAVTLRMPFCCPTGSVRALAGKRREKDIWYWP